MHAANKFSQQYLLKKETFLSLLYFFILYQINWLHTWWISLDFHFYSAFIPVSSCLAIALLEFAFRKDDASHFRYFPVECLDVGTTQFSLSLVPALGSGLCFPSKDFLESPKAKLPSWLAIPLGEVAACEFEMWVPGLFFFPNYMWIFSCIGIATGLGSFFLSGLGIPIPLWGLWNTQPMISHLDYYFGWRL